MLVRHETQNAPLVGGKSIPCLRDQARHGLATGSTRLHEAGKPKLAQVPRDEGLTQADVVDELGDRRLALGEASNDA